MTSNQTSAAPSPFPQPQATPSPFNSHLSTFSSPQLLTQEIFGSPKTIFLRLRIFYDELYGAGRNKKGYAKSAKELWRFGGGGVGAKQDSKHQGPLSKKTFPLTQYSLMDIPDTELKYFLNFSSEQIYHLKLLHLRDIETGKVIRFRPDEDFYKMRVIPMRELRHEAYYELVMMDKRCRLAQDIPQEIKDDFWKDFSEILDCDFDVRELKKLLKRNRRRHDDFEQDATQDTLQHTEEQETLPSAEKSESLSAADVTESIHRQKESPQQNNTSTSADSSQQNHSTDAPVSPHESKSHSARGHKEKTSSISRGSEDGHPSLRPVLRKSSSQSSMIPGIDITLPGTVQRKFSNASSTLESPAKGTPRATPSDDQSSTLPVITKEQIDRYYSMHMYAEIDALRDTIDFKKNRNPTIQDQLELQYNLLSDEIEKKKRYLVDLFMECDMNFSMSVTWNEYLSWRSKLWLDHQTKITREKYFSNETSSQEDKNDENGAAVGDGDNGKKPTSPTKKQSLTPSEKILREMDAERRRDFDLVHKVTERR